MRFSFAARMAAPAVNVRHIFNRSASRAAILAAFISGARTIRMSALLCIIICHFE
jgi:hypothetical protein